MIEYIDKEKFRKNLVVDSYGRTDIVKVAIALEKAKVDELPEQKKGRWIIHSSGHGRYATNWAECSECRVCGSPLWKVCPVCKAKMDPVTIPVNNYDPDDLMGEYEDENY